MQQDQVDLVQQRLAAILAPHYSVILAASNDGQYHLEIQDAASDWSLEDTGSISSDFVERMQTLGKQLKAILESETFKRMASPDPSRPLVWISDRPTPRPGW
ncbi:hypothetical protein ACIPZF_25500 [Pseudomonas sp. NPDC089752]|uniref:hypothetical protein n=1 Tax=Pseudomonas sp. NPDC089752 TaxID=3364472 RepID=UPI0037F7A864